MRKMTWLYILLVLMAGVVITLIVCNSVVGKTKKHTYSSVADIPYRKVGVVLGTAPQLSNGRVNLYFKYRIQAAAELYHAGKVKYFIVSGDNSRPDYNEPQAMKDSLVAAGVPASHIYPDYAGFRTLDSMVRAQIIFGLNDFTVISQKFHNERAIYLAQAYHIHPIGYNAKDVTRKAGFKTRIRELLARVAVFRDLAVNKQPKYLGEMIRMPD